MTLCPRVTNIFDSMDASKIVLEMGLLACG
jgi:hypothetical protein